MVIATTELDLCDCGALVPKIDGPTHAYFGNNAGCWQLFGEVLARDYADYQHGALHNLAVDTYAVQHPRNADRRNRQSVGVHLISLRACSSATWMQPRPGLLSPTSRSPSAATDESGRT